jgi:hypothetical protein
MIQRADRYLTLKLAAVGPDNAFAREARRGGERAHVVAVSGWQRSAID